MLLFLNKKINNTKTIVEQEPRKVIIEDEILSLYRDYSVIVAERTFPSYYDGLKNVQRRIIYILHTIHRNDGWK